jgi:hypothetical protein
LRSMRAISTKSCTNKANQARDRRSASPFYGFAATT